MTHAMVFTGYDQRGGGVKNKKSKKSKGGASKGGGEEKEEAGPAMVAGSLGGGDSADGLAPIESLTPDLEALIAAGEMSREEARAVASGVSPTVVDMGDQVDKWRVENSWGEKDSRKGYLVMSDEWFTDHMYVEEKEACEEKKPALWVCCTAVVCGVRWCAVRRVVVCTVHGGVYCVLCTVLQLTRPHTCFPLSFFPLILPLHSLLSFFLSILPPQVPGRHRRGVSQRRTQGASPGWAADVAAALGPDGSPRPGCGGGGIQCTLVLVSKCETTVPVHW